MYKKLLTILCILLLFTLSSCEEKEDKKPVKKEDPLANTTQDTKDPVVDNEDPIYKLVYEYDTYTIEDYYQRVDDLKIKSIITYDNGIVSTTSYHQNGMKNTTTITHPDPSLDSTQTCQEDGLFCKTIYASGDEFHTTYYIDGTVKTDTVYASNGQIDYYEYDETGNVTSHTLKDVEGNEYKIK